MSDTHRRHDKALRKDNSISRSLLSRKDTLTHFLHEMSVSDTYDTVRRMGNRVQGSAKRLRRHIRVPTATPPLAVRAQT